LKRQDKEQLVAYLREEFTKAKALVLTDFQGLKVSETDELRRELRKHGVSFKVLKNTLARIAYRDTDVAILGPDVFGVRAAVWTHSLDQVPAMAKVLVDFAKGHPQLQIKSGMLEGKVFSPADLDAISKLPPREVLLGMLLGTMMAPVSAFVNTLAAVPRSFLTVLKAIGDKKVPSAGSSEPSEVPV